MHCFTLRHRFGGGPNVYVFHLPKEIANVVRKYLSKVIRDDVIKLPLPYCSV